MKRRISSDYFDVTEEQYSIRVPAIIYYVDYFGVFAAHVKV